MGQSRDTAPCRRTMGTVAALHWACGSAVPQPRSDLCNTMWHGADTRLLRPTRTWERPALREASWSKSLLWTRTSTSKSESMRNVNFGRAWGNKALRACKGLEIVLREIAPSMGLGGSVPRAGLRVSPNEPFAARWSPNRPSRSLVSDSCRFERAVQRELQTHLRPNNLLLPREKLDRSRAINRLFQEPFRNDTFISQVSAKEERDTVRIVKNHRFPACWDLC